MKKLNLSLTGVCFIIVCIGVIIFVLFTPLVSQLFTVWSFAGMAAGAAVILAALFWDTVKAYFKNNLKKRWFRISFTAICIFVSVCVIIGGVFLWGILRAGFFDGQPPENATVVVLGCQVRANGNPSKTLRQRLDCAYEYLTENENAVCIVSGGQGPDEPMTEAQAMFDYLTEKGISPERIYIEDASHDTNQNMKFTARIIEREGLSRDIAVITNSFHQYRASVYASHYGLCAYSVNSKTDTFAYPTYLVREVFAVVKMKVITA